MNLLKNIKDVYKDTVISINCNKAFNTPISSTIRSCDIVGTICDESDNEVTIYTEKTSKWPYNLDGKVIVSKTDINKISIYNAKEEYVAPLKFLGRGSCFNVKEGNTAAYLEVNDTLYLIDCGETVFKRIMELRLLEAVENVTIIITHLHSDHVGSLPSLILYCHFALGIRPTIVCKLPYELTAYLTICGVPTEIYIISSYGPYDNKDVVINMEEEDHEVIHSYGISLHHNNEIHTGVNSPYGDSFYKMKPGHTPSYGVSIYLKASDIYIYYSSDTKTPLFNSLSKKIAYDYYYYDAAIRQTSGDGSRYPHCYLGDLIKVFNNESISLDRLRLIHIDDEDTFRLAELLNIECVTVE